MSAVSQLTTRDVTGSSVTLLWTPPPVQYDAYHLTFTSQVRTVGPPLHLHPHTSPPFALVVCVCAVVCEGGVASSAKMDADTRKANKV